MSSSTWPGCAAIDDWRLTPEGGAIHLAERTAVIADVHLGYEWARGSAGDSIPAHSLAETLRSLESLLGRAPIDRLVVAGDLVESPRPCRRTAMDIVRLCRWLANRDISLTVTSGNHDRSLLRMLEGSGEQPLNPVIIVESLIVAGWTVTHGHRPIDRDHSIAGHYHPAVRLASHMSPCFLVTRNRIVLPAFSRNTAGCDVAVRRLPREWQTIPWVCMATAGYEVLDFGLLSTLADRIRSSGVSVQPTTTSEPRRRDP